MYEKMTTLITVMCKIMDTVQETDNFLSATSPLEYTRYDKSSNFFKYPALMTINFDHQQYKIIFSTAFYFHLIRKAQEWKSAIHFWTTHIFQICFVLKVNIIFSEKQKVGCVLLQSYQKEGHWTATNVRSIPQCMCYLNYESCRRILWREKAADFNWDK